MKGYIQCVECGKKIDWRNKPVRCWECEIKRRHIASQSRKFVCSECGEETKYNKGGGLCDRCWRKHYKQRPDVKEKHAALERKRRSEGKHLEYEKKRSKSEKRIMSRRLYVQSYYRRNRERLIQYQRDYYHKNREKCLAWEKLNNEQRRSLPNNITQKQWYELLAYHNWRCAYCGIPSDFLEKDHKIPITRGGETTKENILPCCHSCNCRKNDRTVEEYRDFLISIGEVPVF